MVEIVRFDETHLQAVLDLCRAQGWPSLPEDAGRALRALTAPGVSTAVALDPGLSSVEPLAAPSVVGFAQAMGDGEIQAYLALVLVSELRRGEGIGRMLVRAVAEMAGGTRVDVLSDEGSTAFYESFAHKVMPGYRVYPLDVQG